MKCLLRCCVTSLILTLSVVMSACGQKGRLVMPPNPTPISTPYPVAQPKPLKENPVSVPDPEKN